jgi:hypothetical protein
MQGWFWLWNTPMAGEKCFFAYLGMKPYTGQIHLMQVKNRNIL